MPKRTPITGEKNLISKRLIELRRQRHMSQRLLAYKLQLRGYDMDKNVITRIETNKRYVTDIELKALTEIFDVSYEYLIEGKDILEPYRMIETEVKLWQIFNLRIIYGV